MRFVIALVLVLWIGLAVWAFAEPRSVVLLTGVVEFAEHEVLDGSVNISTLTIAAPRNSTPLLLLKDLRGQTVEVRLTVKEPRALKEIGR